MSASNRSGEFLQGSHPGHSSFRDSVSRSDCPAEELSETAAATVESLSAAVEHGQTENSLEMLGRHAEAAMMFQSTHQIEQLNAKITDAVGGSRTHLERIRLIPSVEN